MKKILPLICTGILFISGRVFAQVDMHNTGILFITGNTDTVFVNGNFSNNVTAALSNNGMLYIKHDLSNYQASMITGTGTLYLSGTAAQAVNGTQPFKTNNLFSANAAGIIINNNLSVAGLHTFSSGLITTSATPNYMIYEAGSSYTGANDSRHVYGWVKKLGNTDFIFPVGNLNYLRAVELTNLTAASEFNIRHNGSPTPNRISLYNPLVYVDSAEYWTIHKVSGSAARIAMNWDNSKVPFPNLMVSDIRVAYYDGIFWRSIGGAATGSALTTGTITSNSVSAFNSNFTFGSISYTLPVTITSFTAQRNDGFIKLNWVVSNETNVFNYELQRSDDGINFYNIYVQLPYNTNNSLYHYDDNKTLKGTTFYRLKVNDAGGRISYSPIVSIAANNSGKLLYVITNPVDNRIDLYADAAVKGVYNYTITSTSGQVMQAGSLDIKHTGTYSIHLKPLISSGAYILLMQNETNRLQKMIMKN